MFDALAPPLAEQVVVGAEAHSIRVDVTTTPIVRSIVFMGIVLKDNA